MSFEYLKPDESLIVYEGYKFAMIEVNKNNSIRWRCLTCEAVTMSTLENDVIRQPLPHRSRKCIQMFEIEIECYKSYEKSV